MKISILRGQNQIGGSIVEISAGKTRIFFDVGVNLDESVNTEIPGIDGLFCGKKNCDGGFISHYHSDHIGLIPHLLPDIPVYMGEQSYRIFSAAANYREKHVSFVPKFLNDREKIRIGNITITPFGCDHSAYDAYMFLIEADGKSALYTGDFRANGRLDFQELLKAVPTVDAVITEGTMLSRDTEQKNLNGTF